MSSVRKPPPLSAVPEEIEQALVAAFRLYNLPPALGLAIAWVESSFNPHAVKLTAGDGKRGGAFGMCQMTLKTAKSIDPEATASELIDTAYNAKLAADLISRNARAYARIPGASEPMSDMWVKDMASMYNSGRILKKAPVSTQAYAALVWEAFQLYNLSFQPVEPSQTSSQSTPQP